jgi:hypothetical protein
MRDLVSIVNDCSNVTEAEVITIILQDLDNMYALYRSGDLQKTMPDMPDYATEMDYTNAISGSVIQLLWSAMALFKGVQIFVEDRALVEMLLRANIDASTDDVYLPFPVCEFIVPRGIPLIDGYQLAGCLCADSRRFDLRKEVEKYGVWKLPYAGPAEGITVGSTLKATDGTLDKFVHSISLPQGAPVESVKSGIEVKAASRLAMNASAKFCAALCLYLQSKEGQLALEPRTTSTKQNGVTPALGRQLKRRKSITIKDLITPKRDVGMPGGGTHASPGAHWRKLHMRALRHERFNRNPDGSVRVVLVNASLVNGEGVDTVTTKRKLAVL